MEDYLGNGIESRRAELQDRFMNKYHRWRMRANSRNAVKALRKGKLRKAEKLKRNADDHRDHSLMHAGHDLILRRRSLLEDKDGVQARSKELAFQKKMQNRKQ